ncbi:hypothetical protein, conserved [Plasmodium gonderi]|uniref:Uncharacterized protein n=1 Tax=Plasmodium gonderi TaxID=77519 RepID=A0A1Y1JB14_PLAGO|nr:hypothetical protein, conserved [Plasmodium gonderi]GAW78878.1 hypothetical protein, conserved [Plasmodium gonderi]
MKKLKSALKGICFQLNSNNEKDIENGLKNLYMFIKENDNISEEEYNTCVDIIIENNYIDIIILVLSAESEKTKENKLVFNLNLRYIEIVFYTLHWLLRNKFGKIYTNKDNKNESECVEDKVKRKRAKFEEIQFYDLHKKYKNAGVFKNLGLFLCENINFLEIVILKNFSFNRIFILNSILYFIIFHEKFYFVFLSSSLILNLIELKKNVKMVSELKRKNELHDLEHTDSELDDAFNYNVENRKINGLYQDEQEDEEQSEVSWDNSGKGPGEQIEEDNGRDAQNEWKVLSSKDNHFTEDETLLCSYNFQQEIIFLYKYLVHENGLGDVRNEGVKNLVMRNCGFYGEMLIKKKNGKTEFFKEEIIDRKMEKKNKKGRNEANIQEVNNKAVNKEDFEVVRLSLLVLCAYIYLESTRGDKIHMYFHSICEEIFKIYCSCGESLRYYILLCFYEILKKSETYKNMNIFLNVIKLVGLFLNDVQSDMDTTLLFFINELLKSRKFNEIYKISKFNCNCIFLLKCSGEDEKGNKAMATPNDWQVEKKRKRKSSFSSYFSSKYCLIVNCNKKDRVVELDNMINELFDGVTKMQNKRYVQIRDLLFVLSIQKKDIRRMCLIFSILELYISTCIRETKQYLIMHHMKEEEVFRLRDRNYNDEKQINNKVNNAFLTFLTDLKIKFFINHYVIVISVEKYHHFINLYYSSTNVHVVTCDEKLFFFLMLFIELSKIFFVQRTNLIPVMKEKKEMHNICTQVNNLFSFPFSDMSMNRKNEIVLEDNIRTTKDNEERNGAGSCGKKRKISIASQSDEDTREGEKLRRKKKNKLEIRNSMLKDNSLNRSRIETNTREGRNKCRIKIPKIFQYKYVYQRINKDVVRNTNFLNLFTEVIHYKILVELHEMMKKDRHSEEMINDQRVVMQNMKESNNYIYNIDNKLNYNKKLEEVLFFFIPMHNTKCIIYNFTKKDKHDYYNYFIISYLYYTFEIFKCVCIFVLYLDSFIPIPKGVNKIALLNRIREDITLSFYNILSPYYLFDVGYINRYIINEIKGVNMSSNGLLNNCEKGMNKMDNYTSNQNERNNQSHVSVNVEHPNRNGSDSDDYTFNIGMKDHEIINSRNEQIQKNVEYILQLHYFVNNVDIDVSNLYVYHFVIVTNFINLFDDYELKKKLLNDLYSQKRIIEIRDFELFANINENIYKIFLKSFIEKCYFTMESYNLLDNLFSVLIYYKKKVILQNEKCAENVYENYYYFMETFLHKMLKKTKFFDSHYMDDVLLFLNFLRAIPTIREFVIVLSVFCRIFNFYKSRSLIDLGEGVTDREVIANVSNKVDELNTSSDEEENYRKNKVSSFFRLLVELFFTSNLNFALKGIPMLKIINDSKEEKLTKGNSSNVFDYTVKDIVQVYINYLDYITYVLLLNPYVYPFFEEKLKKKRSIGELFCAFSRRKDLFPNGDNMCDNEGRNSSSCAEVKVEDNSGITSPCNVHNEESKMCRSNMVEGSEAYLAYQIEKKLLDVAFENFQNFQQSVHIFLDEIKKVKMGEKSSPTYQEEIEMLCGKEYEKDGTNSSCMNQSNFHFFSLSDDTSERTIPNGCKNVLQIYLLYNITYEYTSMGNLECTMKKCQEEELLFCNLCNISSLIFNYFFTIYVYINNKRNANIDTLLNIVCKINKLLEVYLALSGNINRNVNTFIKHTRKYEDIENIISSCDNRTEEVDKQNSSNSFFQKFSILGGSTCLQFIEIFKNELFGKLIMKLLQNVDETNRDVFSHFIHLNLYYIYRSIHFFKLKKEKYKRSVADSLVRLAQILAEQDTQHKEMKKIREKCCFLILFLLQKLKTKDCYINKLIIGRRGPSHDCDRSKHSNDTNEESVSNMKSQHFLLKQVTLFFINLMASQRDITGFNNGIKNGFKCMHKHNSNSVPLLINTIMQDKSAEIEMSDILNELCKLYAIKCYREKDCSLDCAIIEKIIHQDVRRNGNSTSGDSTTISVNSNNGGISNQYFLRHIRNDKIHLQWCEDVERRVKAYILNKYIDHFDFDTSQLEEKFKNSKENLIFIIFMYVMKNKYNPPLFEEIDKKVLDRTEYKEIFKLPRKEFSATLAENYLNKFMSAYKYVQKRDNKISFLLLNMKKVKNKNCLFIALSILYFLGNMLSKKDRMVQLFKEYDKKIVKKICEVIFFYFYGYFYKNDIYKDERILKCYERITFFFFKSFFKSLKKGNAEMGHGNSISAQGGGTQNEFNKNDTFNHERSTSYNRWRDQDTMGTSNNCFHHGNNNGIKHENSNKVHSNNSKLKYNENFINNTLKRRSDYCVLLVLLLQLLNQNIRKFNLEKMVDEHLFEVFIHISFMLKGGRNHFYYENIMKEYIYIFNEHDFNSLKKEKKMCTVFYAYFLLLKYAKLRNLCVLALVETFFKDANIEKVLLFQMDVFRVKRRKKNYTPNGYTNVIVNKNGDKNTLIFMLKLIKIFYEEWYDMSKDTVLKQVINLKTLNKNIFNGLKKLYNYTLENIDIHIRNIFFVDISHYLKSVTMESILDNKLIDEVLKFKEFNLNSDANYDWLNMNTSMLNKTCLYFYINENVRRKLENGENHFSFYLHMNKSGKSECCEEEVGVLEEGEEERNSEDSCSKNRGVSNRAALDSYDAKSDVGKLCMQKWSSSDNGTEWINKKGDIVFKYCRTQLPHCLMSQNDYIKKETFFLAHKNKLKDNIYDYLFLLCLIVSKLIFCFILMSEKLRVFFYHFRILYTCYHHEKVFLNFDLLNMQEINRKIKSYIKKYPDIHFYIDYDNNENEESKTYGGGGDQEQNSYTDNRKDKKNWLNSYNNGISQTNEYGNNNFPFRNSNKLITYDEEKEHFYHLKKNEKNNSSCKFCIKFKKIHSVHRSTRILDLLDKDEKTNIKNMIYYGKTIRTSIFLKSPYDVNAYKNCSTFREEVHGEQEKADGGLENGNIDADRSRNNNNVHNGRLNGAEEHREKGSNNRNYNSVNVKYVKNARMKKNELDNTINSDCIVDNSDLLYGRKTKGFHFKKNYKKLLKKYFLNDIDFFGKWIKMFSMNALKILIFCLSSNDIIVRMISIKGLSIFYQLIENSFVLYKIRKKLNSFRRSSTSATSKDGENFRKKWENNFSHTYINSNNTYSINNGYNNSGGIRKKERTLIIPFKELFYLFFFMKKLKYSVDPNSYYINPCVSSYSFFLINEIYKKNELNNTLRILIRNKTFSLHFFHAYLNNEIKKTNFMSLNIINFFIISTQALLSTSYDLRRNDKDMVVHANYTDQEQYPEVGLQQHQMDYARYSTNYGNSHKQNIYYRDDDTTYQEGGGYSKQKNNIIDRSFFATSNMNHRMIYDFQNDDNDVEEMNYQNEKDVQNKTDKEETVDKLHYIQMNHKNAIKTILNILNKNNIFEIYLTIFFSNHLNYNMLKKFLILLITSSSVLPIEYMKFDCTEKKSDFLNDEGTHRSKKEEEDNNNHNFNDTFANGIGYVNEYDEGQEISRGYVYYNESRFHENTNTRYNNRNNTQEGGEDKDTKRDNMDNCDVAYYAKNNFVIKLIIKNNILLWIDRVMHQKLFQDEIAFYYPSSFMFPLLNFYDLSNENEKLYMNILIDEIEFLEGKGVVEPIAFSQKNNTNFSSNTKEPYVNKGINKIERREEGKVNGDPEMKVGNKKTRKNNMKSHETKKCYDIYTFSNQTYIEKIIKNRYIMGYIFKESYEKTSEIFFYLTMFVSNIVSNLFYPSVDYSYVFTNVLLRNEKKKIIKFILNNAHKILHKRRYTNNDDKFELWNFWYSNFHKYISIKIRSTVLISKKSNSFRKTNLNIFSNLIKIMKNLNRSLYYIFINLFHKEYFRVFINFKSNEKKEERKINIDNTINLKKYNKSNMKVCLTFIKYIYLIFNNLFSICTSLFDRGISNKDFMQNSISTKVVVDESFVHADISFIVNEVMIFLENLVLLYVYFSSSSSRASPVLHGLHPLGGYNTTEYLPPRRKHEDKTVPRHRDQKFIEKYYLHIHETLLKKTHKKSANFSNYHFYQKIILLVLHMIYKNCYKESKHFSYIFLNKLITLYHFLEGTSRAKIYLYIYELFRIIKKDPLQSLLNHII